MNGAIAAPDLLPPDRAAGRTSASVGASLLAMPLASVPRPGTEHREQARSYQAGVRSIPA